MRLPLDVIREGGPYTRRCPIQHWAIKFGQDLRGIIVFGSIPALPHHVILTGGKNLIALLCRFNEIVRVRSR